MTTPPPVPETIETDNPTYWTLERVLMWSAGGLIGLIVLLFVIGLVLVLNNAAFWAPVIGVFHDITLIVLSVQFILIITAIAVLIAQIARFVNLLQSEIKPITRDAQEALRTIRSTAEFVGKHTTEPLIQTQSFLAGLIAFLRELARISGLLRRNPQGQTPHDPQPKP